MRERFCSVNISCSNSLSLIDSNVLSFSPFSPFANYNVSNLTDHPS